MMNKVMDWLVSDESGQGTLEYSLILVIVSVACITLLITLGSGLDNKYVSIGNTLP